MGGSSADPNPAISAPCPPSAADSSAHSAAQCTAEHVSPGEISPHVTNVAWGAGNNSALKHLVLIYTLCPREGSETEFRSLLEQPRQLGFVGSAAIVTSSVEQAVLGSD